MGLREPGVLLGKYVIIRFVAAGGMCLVYEARAEGESQSVAIKVLHDMWAADEEIRRRFMNEAFMLETMQHPNVVSAFGGGTLPSGEPYMVLEWLPFSLQNLVDDRKSGVEPFVVVRLSALLARTLVFLHAQNIVHRDIKAGNVLLDDDDLTKAHVLRQYHPASTTHLHEPLGIRGVLREMVIVGLHDFACRSKRINDDPSAQRSTKNVNGSGSFTRLASDRILDLLEVDPVILSEHQNRLTCTISPGHDTRFDAGSRNHRLSKASTRIHHDGLRLLFQIAFTHPWVKSRGKIAFPVDAFEAFFEHFTQYRLPRCRYVEQPVCMLNEQVHAVRAKTAVDERSGYAEVFSDKPYGLADFLHRNSMHASHRCEHERFDEVGEREHQRRA
jgi:hypothetical protein